MVNLDVHHAVKGAQANIIPQIPAVSFADGKMIVADNQVHVIKDTQGNELVVFDPTTQYDQQHMPSASILFKPNAMYIVDNAGVAMEHDYPQSLNVTITSESINAFAVQFKRWGIVLFGLMLLVTAYVYRIIASLIFSVVGVFIAMGTKVNLPYAGILRLSVMAQTPVILISTVGAMLDIYVAHAWIAGAVMSLAYLVFGIKAISTTPSATAVPPEEQPAP